MMHKFNLTDRWLVLGYAWECLCVAAQLLFAACVGRMSEADYRALTDREITVALRDFE